MNAGMRILVSALAVIALAPAANAAPKWRVFGIGNYSQIKSEVDGTANRTSTNRELGFGGGLSIEAPFGKMFGFELGGAFLQRKSETGSGAVLTVNYIQVPAQFRMWFGRFVNVGAGGYFATGMGEITAEAGGLEVNVPFGDLDLKAMDYGLLATVGFDIPLGGNAGLIVEGRYTYGLANVDTRTGVTTKYNDLMAVAGIRIGGSKK